MQVNVNFHYEITGDDYARAGEASTHLKRALRKMGLTSEMIRRVSIAMYEGEINMVIHANGGTIDVDVDQSGVSILMRDTGPGIHEIDLAMKEGYTTANDEVRSMGFGAGMGLPNMKKHTDFMKVESTPGTGTTIFMKIHADAGQKI